MHGDPFDMLRAHLGFRVYRVEESAIVFVRTTSVEPGMLAEQFQLATCIKRLRQLD